MASKVVKQLAGNGTGQSLVDRMSAAKYSLAGSGLGRGVVKATTEELTPPKKKHLDYLTSCTNEVNVSIPELAEYLIDRMQQASWVVVMKTFITTHHLMNFGNEKFSQYLAAKSTSLSLPNFMDKSSSIGYEMSQYVKPYSKYINEKTSTYRLMAFDFCKIKRGRDDGILRRMPFEKLMKTVPVLQGQVDVLLEFDPNQKDLNNPVLNSAFTLLYKDLIRLYASYNEGMINLIELYFNMNKKSCKESLDMYKIFLDRTEKVTKFVTLAENAGVGDKGSLGLQTVPPKVLETLENHLTNLEKNKTSSTSDSDDGKSPNVVSNPALMKINKIDLSQTDKKSNQPSKINQSKNEANSLSDSRSQEFNNDRLENLLGEDKSSVVTTTTNIAEKPNEVAVRTQLRRPEQQHSVAVTVKRAGRSPSPARPTQGPMTNRFRDPSPVKPEPITNKENQDEEDFFSHLRDDVSLNVETSPTTPNNARASPFACDEKPLESGDSYWADTNLKSPDSDIKNDTSLFESDLLGLDICSEAVKPITSVETKSSCFADLDDLFGLETCEASNLTDTPLAPSAITPITNKPVGGDDDLFSSMTPINQSYSYTSPIAQPTTNTHSAATATNKPQKQIDVGFTDTLAELAQSLGKTETKWSSKPQTLAGKTRDNFSISTGPTINWSGNNGTSSGNVGNSTANPISATNNENLLADLLG